MNMRLSKVLNIYTLSYILISFVVPTVAIIIIKLFTGIQVPVVNADLLLLSVVCVIIGRYNRIISAIILVFGIFLILLIHISIGIGAIYIDNISLIRQYLGFANLWPWKEISLWAAIGIMSMIPICLIAVRIDFHRTHIVPILLILLFFIALDFISDTQAGHRYIPSNMLTSSSKRTLQLIYTWSNSPGFTYSPIQSPMMAKLVSSSDTHPNSILSVGTESFGLSMDKRFNAAIVKPLYDLLSGKYIIHVGTHAAKGGTLTGEIRELCNLKIAGTPSKKEASLFKNSCLPDYLDAHGYKTLGIHGNSRFFYNRQIVYPIIGFQRTMFYDDFLKAKPDTPKCQTRAFDGICDRAVFSYALNFLGSHRQSFAHVMTLDTHFPLSTLAASDNTCTSIHISNSDLCSYLLRMRNVMATLSVELSAAKNPPDVVYVYGDHPPPYISKEERSYFDRNAVPFITLTRKLPHQSSAAEGQARL